MSKELDEQDVAYRSGEITEDDIVWAKAVLAGDSDPSVVVNMTRSERKAMRKEARYFSDERLHL